MGTKPSALATTTGRPRKEAPSALELLYITTSLVTTTKGWRFKLLCQNQSLLRGLTYVWAAFLYVICEISGFTNGVKYICTSFCSWMVEMAFLFFLSFSFLMKFGHCEQILATQDWTQKRKAFKSMPTSVPWTKKIKEKQKVRSGTLHVPIVKGGCPLVRQTKHTR